MKTPGMQLLCIMLALVAAPLAAQTDAALADHVAAHESGTAPPLFARTAFLEEPGVSAVSLAPDGAHVAWLAKTGRDTSLHLLDTRALQSLERMESLENLESTRLFGVDRLRSAEWGADGKLVLDLGDAAGILDPAQPAAPSFVARLDMHRGDYLLGASGARAGGVLVVRMPQPRMHALELVDASGNAAKLFTSSDRIEKALVTHDGERVFAETVSLQARFIVEVRDGAVRTLLTCPIVATCRLVSHEPDTDTLWLLSSHDSDLLGLRALALADGALRTVHEDPAGIYDLDAVSLRGARPVLATYEAGAQHHALDAAAGEHLDRIRELLPQRHFTLALAGDGDTWLVTARTSVLREPRYYLYDASTMAVREILAVLRNDSLLPADALSAKIPLEYPARDGLHVHGYVSLPKGVPLHAAPLVVMPHGGPWAHVSGDYFSLTQFLVNRGYIVFEPNFRGSTGYGRAWMEAANREFGDSAVQHDIVDGVQYLLSRQIGDANRLGIVGGSFGGFSVLSGLAFTPGLFKAGVAAVPPASMGNSVRHQLRRSARSARPDMEELLRTLIVDVGDRADMERLQALSPQAHLANIAAPLLILAGADDATVDIGHVKEYTLELLNLGKTVSLLIDEKAGHAMDSPLMWQAFFYGTETLFARYLGGQSQAVGEPRLASYLQRKLLLNTNEEFVIR